jgi:hypothetical protein
MKKFLTLIALLFSVPALGQVTFQFVPDIYGRNVDGLLNCRILNASGNRSATLTVSVNERKSGSIVTLTTTSFNLSPGLNSIPGTSLKSSNIQFYNNPVSVITRHDHNFPAGDYEYCFTLNFSGSGADLPVEQCFSYELIPFSELHLSEPYDRDTICEKRPLLSWQPLLPGISGSAYQLVISEIKSGQNAVEALNYNLPVLNQSMISSPILPYPSIARELEEGKSYAWQVTAYKDQTILNRSEVWTFRVGCRENKKPPVMAEDGYRDIEDLARGNYYVAVGTIKFVVLNAYNEQAFKYQIENLNNPGKKIKGMPKVKLLKGKNKILIDLANTDSFTDGNSYIMKLWLPDGTAKNLRFIYKD